MSIQITIPELAESIEDGTLQEWKVGEGDHVNRDDLLIELETDKVVLEIVAPADGIISKIIEADGTVVTSQTPIAILEEGSEEKSSINTPEPEKSNPTETTPATDSSHMTPHSRRLVRENNIDPTTLSGSGKHGTIKPADVKQTLPSTVATAPITPTPDDSNERRVPMTRLRAKVAERLVEAQQTAAILTTFNEINMQPVMDLRTRYKELFEKKHGIKLGFMSFFVKACSEAMKKFPIINASIDNNDIVYHDLHNIGVAVSTPRGLVVPVLRNTAAMTYSDVELTITDFAKRARGGQLNLEELMGGTFSITNGGTFGSLLSTPILNPPQSAILGMHSIQQRPMAENGEVVIRPMMYTALSYDHRIIDGRDAVQFLVTLKQELEDPARMLLAV
jgi:2-oxoglutarate dehydrogenase E2 component (dihydrolipoamide succinyltransferase)